MFIPLTTASVDNSAVKLSLTLKSQHHDWTYSHDGVDSAEMRHRVVNMTDCVELEPGVKDEVEMAMVRDWL